MTPSLFDLPLRLSDAIALATIVIECAGAHSKSVAPEIRSRIASRCGGIQFESLRPLPETAERDPTHPSALYICVDGIEGQPLLLRAAPASTPSSGIFPNSILIGRTRVASNEVVLNALPFGPGDHESVRAFSQYVNKAFVPRPAGSRPVIRVKSDSPAEAFPAAFAEFRAQMKTTGKNQAAFATLPGQDAEDFYFTLVWSAIRSGWREGYALESAAAPLVVARDVTMVRADPDSWIWL